MDIDDIHRKLLDHFGAEVILELTPTTEEIRDPFITVTAGKVDKVCLFCKVESDLAFDFCQSITGMDTGETLTCVYHLYSYTRRHTLVIKTSMPKSKPVLPSATMVWPAADWYEREVFDMYGVRFEGHPDLRRLLLPDDWEGHPMLKDYEERPFYHSKVGAKDNPLEIVIPTTRENPLDLLEEKDASS